MRFTAKVEVTGRNLIDVPPETWRRMLCHVIINHLSGQFLVDATDSLVGDYQWQFEQSQIFPSVPQLQSIPVDQLRPLQTAAFALPDPDEE